MHKMKSDNRGGFPMYSIDLQEKESRMQKVGGWLGVNSMEIVLIGLFIAMVVGVGMLMHTTAETLDLVIQYVDEEEEMLNSKSQMRNVIDLHVVEKAEAHVDPVTRAELPPYWTAPEETH